MQILGLVLAALVEVNTPKDTWFPETRNCQTESVVISSGNGADEHVVIVICKDGHVELNPKVARDAAALEIFKAIEPLIKQAKKDEPCKF